MRHLVLTSLLLIAICAPAGASAQMLGTSGLSLTISPQYPRPYDTVTVTPQSTEINLSASQVTITANGAVIEEGSGGRSATFVMGGPGSVTTLRATATQGAVTKTTELVLRPADVALVVEPLTTDHPLFAGGSLVAPEGQVRLVAIADLRNSGGARIAPSTLSYTWRVGNRILTEQSGIGRTTFTARAPVRYRNANVSVTVSTADETIAGYAATEIAPASPKLYVYRADPLLGIDLAHALSGTFRMPSEEESFFAIPYFFKEDPSITWTINGSTSGSDQLFTVRTENAQSGSAVLGVAASDTSSESASASFTVNFAGAAVSPFGF